MNEIKLVLNFIFTNIRNMNNRLKRLIRDISVFSCACLALSIHAHGMSGDLGPNTGYPRAFTENKGQVFGYDGLPHPEVKFVFDDGATQIFLLETGIAYQFKELHYPQEYKAMKNGREEIGAVEKALEFQKQMRTETFRMDMTFVGANPNCDISVEGKSLDYTNFYNHQVLDVHSYSKLVYHDLYPGIDWIVYTDGSKIKYDFIVHPNANPSLIHMQFTHQENLHLNKDGSFTLTNRMGSITEEKPVSIQEGKSVVTRFVLHDNILSFELANYQAGKELIIDPALSWGTYYGAGAEMGFSCVTDAAGNVYLTGAAGSTSGIASGGHQNILGGSFDAFLVKFNSAGVRQWATYYGGAGNDQSYSCATDGSGNVYLAGVTNSTTNIASGGHQNTIGGGQIDAFLVKFSSVGVRLWGTYYGGTGNDYGYSCATDNSGHVFLAGRTNSSADIASGGHQNTTGGSDDAFLIKFNGLGIRQWGTYYGGNGNDEGRSCAVDAGGNIYLAGHTDSGNAIAAGGHQNTFGGLSDAFLVKFMSNGVRLWGTYYGGIADDDGNSCATDVVGNVYLGGATTSSTGIASGGHQNNLAGALPGSIDAYLVKFNGAGIRQWGTYYGGNGSIDQGYSCVTDAAGNVFLAGITNSSVGISLAGYKNTFGGNRDAFLVKFDGSGVRQWGTYFGNSGSNGIGDDLGYSTCLDAAGNVYLAGGTDSNAGIASGGHQNVLAGASNAYLAKFCNTPSQPSAISGNTLVCFGSTNSFSVVLDPAIISYSWSLPGGGWLGGSLNHTISLTVGSAGNLSVTSSNTCGASVSQSLYVSVLPLPSVSVNSGTICLGQSFTMNPSGASSYTFSGGSSVVGPTITTNYSVSGTSSAGCVSSSAAVSGVTVIPLPVISVNSGTICAGDSFTINPSGASTYTISGGSFTVNPTGSSGYSVNGTNIAGCVSTIAAVSNVTVFALPNLSVTSTKTLLCVGETATLVVSGSNSYTWMTGAIGNSLVITPTLTSNYSLVGLNLNGCANTTSITQIVDACNGINHDFKNESPVKIYPNPNNGEFFVMREFSGSASLTIFDAQGRRILILTKIDQKTLVDISEQAEGIYYIEISNEYGRRQYLKFSKY